MLPERNLYLWNNFALVLHTLHSLSKISKFNMYKSFWKSAVYYNSIPLEDRKSPIDTEKYPAKLGFTLELCAGIVDKKISLAEIAVEEIFEECGYRVEPEKLERIIQFQ